MGKRSLGTQLPKPVVIDGGKQQRPRNLCLSSILTADEYRSAVIALVNTVADDSEDNGTLDGLSSALKRLLLSRYDPPLPLYWTLVSVEKSLWLDRTSKDPLEFGTSILNFAGRALQSLKSLSAVNASGQTALSSIAPIVGLLYDVTCLLSSTVGSLDEIQGKIGNIGCNGKKARKLVRKLKELIRDLLSFTSLCHCKDLKPFERSFSLPPAPKFLLENFPDFIYPPLPLASKKAKSLSRDLSNSAVFADIVFGEAVLLQLIVETLDRRILLKKQNTDFSVGQDEFVQKLKSLSVHSVWAARSPSPSEMLLDLLLEKRLPLLDLLAAEEEILVRGVLSEVVLIDAPLFSLFGEAVGESNSSLSSLDHTSVLFMKKLSIARRAVAFFRSQQERSRVASLLTQITDWHVPHRLSKWLKSQKKQRLPVIALQDHQALINWLVNTAERSVFAALFEKSVATWSSGLTPVGTAEHVKVLELETGDAHADGEGEDLFFVDTAGETELSAIDPSAADLDFTAAAQAMKGDSDKIKKTKTGQSKLLFRRHEQSSAGTKRLGIEVNDVRITSSSGSDTEDSEDNRRKSAKMLKNSKQKAVDVRASSEEGEDDDNDDALPSGQLSGGEVASPVKPGDCHEHQQAEHCLSERTEELAGEAATDEYTRGVGSEEVLSQPDREMVITLVAASEVDVRNSSTTFEVEPALQTEGRSAKKNKKSKYPENPDIGALTELCPPQTTVEPLSQPDMEMVITSVSMNGVDIGKVSSISQVEPVFLTEGKSAKKKKKMKSKDLGDPDMEAPAELYPPQRTKELAPGVGTQELTGGVGTEELPSRPDEEIVITSVSADEVNIRDTLTTSQVGLVAVSVGNSAKKEKRSKDPGDSDMELPAELDPPKRTEELAAGVGTEELTGRVRIEELPSQPDERMVITSVSANAVDTRDSLITSQVGLVALSVVKSAKKKKSKDPGESDMEAPAEIHPPKSTEEPAVGVGTEELTGGVGTEELPSQPDEGIVITANEVDIRGSLTSSKADVVPPSMGKSAKKKKPRGFEDTDMTAPVDVVGGSKVVSLCASTAKKKSVDRDSEADDEGKCDSIVEKSTLVSGTILEVETRADIQGEEVEDIAQKAVTTSYEVVEIRRSLPPSSILTNQNEGTDNLGGIGDTTGVVLSSTLRNVEEEIPVVKSSKKKRVKQHPREGDEGAHDQVFDMIKEELVTASGMFSSADLIDALQVKESLPVDQQFSSKTKTTRRKRARLGEDGSSTRDVGTMAIESAVTVSAVNSEKTRSSNETIEDENVSQGDVTTAEEEALLSASLTAEILGNRKTEDADGISRDQSEQNGSEPVVTQVNPPDDSVVSGAEGGPQDTARPSTESPMKNMVEEVEQVPQGTPLKKNGDGTGTPRSRRQRVISQTDVKLLTVMEERVQPKEEVCEEARIARPAKMLEGGEGQEELEVRTPDAEDSDREAVASVKPSSRKRKLKPEISQLSGGSDTSNEILYQRRTRSGRALGTPPATPSRKAKMRRKLVLEPLEEEK